MCKRNHPVKVLSVLIIFLRVVDCAFAKRRSDTGDANTVGTQYILSTLDIVIVNFGYVFAPNAATYLDGIRASFNTEFDGFLKSVLETSSAKKQTSIITKRLLLQFFQFSQNLIGTDARIKLDIKELPCNAPVLVNNIGCWARYAHVPCVNNIIGINRFLIFIRE